MNQFARAWIVLPAAFSLWHQTAWPSAPKLVAYENATLIDGQGGAAIQSSVVVTRDSEIVAAGPARDVRVPPGARVVDLQHRWVVPGLIDAHVHFFESGRPDGKYPPKTSDPSVRSQAESLYTAQVEWIRSRAAYTLERYICSGVTSAISVGGPTFEYEVKTLAVHRGPLAPSVYVSVGPLTTVSSDRIFLPFHSSPPVLTAQTASEARDAVQRGRGQGADLVKLGWLAEPNLWEPDPRPMLQAATLEAHRLGLRTDIHILRSDLVDRALDTGVDALAHTPGGVLSDKTIQRLREHHIVVTSTLLIWMRALAEYAPDRSLDRTERECGDPDVIRSWSPNRGSDPTAADLGSRSMLHEVQENLKRLRQAGVDIAIGTDAGNEGLLHGASVHAEIEALADLGFTPEELIVAATRNAARILGRESEIGLVAAGHRADFLVLKSDPLVDVRNLGDIEFIVHRGEAVPRKNVLLEH